jgi:hypothetical protein
MHPTRSVGVVALVVLGVFAVQKSVNGQPGEIVAEAGFNDQVGLHSDPSPGSPYSLGETVYERGEADGWAVGWTVSADGGCCGFGSQRARALPDETFEGDGALHIVRANGASQTWVHRRWSEPQSEIFRLQQRIRFVGGVEFTARPRLSGTENFLAGMGPNWNAVGGTFTVQDSRGVHDTGIPYSTDTWHDITLVIDSRNQVWEFWVDGERYEPEEPLTFRGNPAAIDTVDYISGEEVWIDEIRISSGADAPIVPSKFKRGDSNLDGRADLSDALHTLGVLFLGRGEFLCEDAADVSNDGEIGLNDAVGLVGYLFQGTLPPPPPFVECGDDSGDDEFGCDEFPPCVD